MRLLVQPPGSGESFDVEVSPTGVLLTLRCAGSHTSVVMTPEQATKGAALLLAYALGGHRVPKALDDAQSFVQRWHTANRPPLRLPRAIDDADVRPADLASLVVRVEVDDEGSGEP